MIHREGTRRYHVNCPYCGSAALTGTFPGITFPRADGSFKATAEETRLHCVRCYSDFSLADAAHREIMVSEKEAAHA